MIENYVERNAESYRSNFEKVPYEGIQQFWARFKTLFEKDRWNSLSDKDKTVLGRLARNFFKTYKDVDWSKEEPFIPLTDSRNRIKISMYHEKDSVSDKLLDLDLASHRPIFCGAMVMHGNGGDRYYFEARCRIHDRTMKEREYLFLLNHTPDEILEFRKRYLKHLKRKLQVCGDLHAIRNKVNIFP